MPKLTDEQLELPRTKYRGQIDEKFAERADREAELSNGFVDGKSNL